MDHAVDAQLRAERARAEARLAELGEEYDAIVAASQDVALDDEHDPDGSTVGFERARVGALVERARARLSALDDALARAAAGSYGVCEACGAAIPVERLEALPETTFCAPCAAARR